MRSVPLPSGSQFRLAYPSSVTGKARSPSAIGSGGPRSTPLLDGSARTATGGAQFHAVSTYANYAIGSYVLHALPTFIRSSAGRGWYADARREIPGPGASHRVAATQVQARQTLQIVVEWYPPGSPLQLARRLEPSAKSPWPPPPSNVRDEQHGPSNRVLVFSSSFRIVMVAMLSMRSPRATDAKQPG